MDGPDRGSEGADQPPPASVPATAAPDPGPATPTQSSAAQLSSLSLPPTRPPYIPQFTAATQMILKRMKLEPSAMGSSLPVGSIHPKPDAQSPAYEDVRRRVVMSMSTVASMTMEMPAPPPRPAASPQPVSEKTDFPTVPHRHTAKHGLSAIRRISSGIPTARQAASAKAVQANASDTLGNATGIQATAPGKAGTKRKRDTRLKVDDADDSSSLSTVPDSADSEPGSKGKATTPQPPPPPTKTKSGRQVQKPATYMPSAAGDAPGSSGRRRAAVQGNVKARLAEQALCRRCTRMHSPASNQLVFCDGCNECWHQMCHDPWVGDDVVSDAGRTWFCAECQALRDRHFATKRHRAAAPRESWAARTPQQKRAYLSTLTQQELVALLMAGLEMHPDLPIFPAAAPRASGTPSAGDAARPAAPARKASSGRGAAGKMQKAAREGQEQEEELDPLEPPWPQAGKGLYSLLPRDEEDGQHLVDEDYEAFSIVIFDENGRKVEENGIRT